MHDRSFLPHILHTLHHLLPVTQEPIEFPSYSTCISSSGQDAREIHSGGGRKSRIRMWQQILSHMASLEQLVLRGSARMFPHQMIRLCQYPPQRSASCASHDGYRRKKGVLESHSQFSLDLFICTLCHRL